MVEAQSEEQGLELIWLAALIDSFLVEVGKSSVEIILKGGRGFVRDLDTVLEDSLWNDITLRWSWWF